MKSESDIDLTFLLTIGVLSLLLLVELIVGVQAVFYNSVGREVQRKDIDQPWWELKNLVDEQKADMHAYHWVDQKKGIVAVPIDEAIDLFVRKQAAQAASAPADHDTGT